jgi:16S rRNA (guanine527-N7)-methyltransferase
MPGFSSLHRIESPEAFATAFSISRETVDRLKTYEALLRQWQKTINLIAPGTLDEIWHRHFADSAQLLRLAPSEAKSWLDLGSGAGFPGLVVAIMLQERGGPAVTLIESDGRKAAFLREVARQTGAVVDIFHGRIESQSTHAKVRKVDVISARALAALDRLLELAAPYAGKDTKFLFLKGKEAEREIEEAGRTWVFDCTRVPSITDEEGRVLVIENLRPRTEG